MSSASVDIAVDETVAMGFALADPQVSSNPSSQTPPAPETPQLIHSDPQPGKGIIKLPNFFNKVANRGIYFHTFLNEELAANPYGGIRQGITASQYHVWHRNRFAGSPWLVRRCASCNRYR